MSTFLTFVFIACLKFELLLPLKLKLFPDLKVLILNTFLNKFGVMKSNPGKQINVAINQCHYRTCIIPKNDPIYNGSMTLK